MYKYTSNGNQNSTYEFIPLPKNAQLPPSLGQDACPWLDDYIKYAQIMSPRSYYGYHLANGLFVLSTTAARRAAYLLGGIHFTNLMIANVGRTSLTAKTTAVRVARNVIKAAELDYLLLPDSCTPQKLVNSMTSRVSENYQQLSIESKAKELLGLGFAGQRGWIFDEFGMFIDGMMRLNGVMADFKSLLRKFDDNEDSYTSATLARGKETIERPYLAMVCSLTPADLAPHARPGSGLWRDGFFARFVFVGPEHDFNQYGRFPKGNPQMPQTLITQLQEWNEYLGAPKVEISGTTVSISPPPPKIMEISDEVYEAFYTYGDELREIIVKARYEDLDGNYSRFPEKAMHVAAIFASLQGKDYIEMNHWARAQTNTEDWRANLHDLISQIGNLASPPTLPLEEKILRAIDVKNAPTCREMQQFTGQKAHIVQDILNSLMDKGEIVNFEDGNTIRYKRSSKKETLNQSE